MNIYHKFTPTDKDKFGKHGNMIAPLIDQLLFQCLEAYKYKVQWALRDYEIELDAQKGSIIIEINQDGQHYIQCRGFNDTWTFLILSKLQYLKPENPFCILDNGLCDDSPTKIPVQRNIIKRFFYWLSS